MVVILQKDSVLPWPSYFFAEPLPPMVLQSGVTLENFELGLVIMSGFALRSMQQISFKEIVSLILRANNKIESLHLYVRQLWGASIH